LKRKVQQIDPVLDTKVAPGSTFGCAVLDREGDDEFEVWAGSQSSNGLMVLKLGGKEINDVPATQVKDVVAILQKALSANYKRNR